MAITEVVRPKIQGVPAGMERVMVIGAAADSSIIDVENGWVRALKRAGFNVYTYSLRNRIKMYTEYVGMLKSGLKCGHCSMPVIEPWDTFKDAGLETILQSASECAVHEAIRHRAGWVLVISGCSLHPNAVAMLQATGRPVATIITESPYNDEDMQDLVRVSSFTGVNDKASIQGLQAVAQGPVVYLPTAYDSELHVPGGEYGPLSDVFFCGTGFDERARLLGSVDWTGVNLHLAGFWPESEEQTVIPDQVEARLGQVSIGWDPRLKPYIKEGLLPNADTAARYRSTRVVLSIHREHPWAYSVGPRVYETAATAAFQVCDDSRPELRELMGDTVATFPSGEPEELGGVVRYYLDRPKLRREMAEASRERVQGHSYDDRLTTLVSHIFPPPSGG